MVPVGCGVVEVAVPVATFAALMGVRVCGTTGTMGSVLIGSDNFRCLAPISSRFGDRWSAPIVSVDNAQISCLEEWKKVQNNEGKCYNIT